MSLKSSLVMVWLVTAGLLSSFASSVSAVEVVTVSAQTERVKLNQHLVFRVTHDNFSLTRIGLENSERWKSFEKLRSHQSGAEKPLIWGAARLFNRSPSSQRYVVDLGGSYIDKASIYLINQAGELIDSADVSFNEALVNRPYLSQQMMLPFDLPANETAWLVIAMQQWPQQVNTISLWSPQSLQLHIQQKQTALGVNAGVLVLLSVAAFTLARGARRRLQISLGTASVAFIFVMLLHSGIWITYFSPYSPGIAGQLLPYAKQVLIVALAWLLWEGTSVALKGTRWQKLLLVTVFMVLALMIAQPWVEGLRAAFWLVAQISALVALTAVVIWRVFKRTSDGILKWFSLLLLPLMVIAWLLIMPRVSTVWQGLSGIVLYTVLTANILALILAQLDKALHRLDYRINSLKAMKKYYRDGYWRFLNRSGEGWFELTDSHQWRRVSKRFLSILGLPSSEFLHRHWPTANMLFGEQAVTWKDEQRQESWRHLTSLERMDGKTIWLEVEIFSDGRGRIQEVTQQVEAEMHLNFLAKHDSLTGLLNYREFHRVLQKQLDRNKPATLLVVNIGGLQVIYDQIEPTTRDQALLQIVLSLRDKLPRNARISRLSDHRLGVLLNDTEQAGFALAYQLVQICREFRFSTQHRVFQFTANAGLAIAKEDTISAPSLVRKAEEALKLAEQLGDYKVHSATDNDQKRLQQQAENDWERRLRDALKNERWALYQQPMLSASQQRDKYCFEVLLRLPEDGNKDPDEALAPQQFLNAALKAGVMGKADRWLIRQVFDYFNHNTFEATRTWRCHINLSVQSLEDRDFITFVEQELEKSNLRPEQLAFEVAEPIVSANFEAAYELFKQLHELGCATVIDQFGTGFNSFRLLRQIPLTQIKINRFWVQNMLLDAIEAELVYSCIKLAKAANVEVSAVGVENDETRTVLSKQQINYIQGYICGRPKQWQLAKN
ncbi:MAG: EAL domain-containing protein [Pseudomonadota bacterium]